ncbi:MAG: XdhC family protein [Thermoplasmatota archaeon]
MKRILAEMQRLYDARVAFVECRVVDAVGSVPGKLGATMLVPERGAIVGTVGGAGLEEKVKTLARAALAGGKGGVHEFTLANWREGGLDAVCGGTVKVALTVHRAMPHLLLLGGGHVAKALADQCDLLEWSYTVADSRAEFANAERFPRADATVAQPLDKWLSAADLARFSHAFILGHDHKLDVEALEALLPRFAGHVGVIGSKAKHTSIVERLRKRGLDDARIARIHTPIGLDIGAETPEEIAVAVVAEIMGTSRRSP